MKHTKKLATILLIAALAAGNVLPGLAADQSPNTVRKQTTTTSSGELKVKAVKSYKIATGKTYSLPAALKQPGAVYKSSNSNILKVDKNTGKFKGVGGGTAYVVITSGSQKTYVKVTITGSAATTQPNNGTGVKTGENSVEFNLGGSSKGNGQNTKSSGNTLSEAEIIAIAKQAAADVGLIWDIDAKTGGHDPHLSIEGKTKKETKEYFDNYFKVLLSEGHEVVYVTIEPSPAGTPSIVVWR